MFRKSLIIICALVALWGTPALAQSVAEKEAQLRAEYDKYIAEIEAMKPELDRLKGQEASVQRDVAILTAQIKEAQLAIKARTLEINRLTKEIGVKNSDIKGLEARLARGQDSLANLVRRVNEIDSYSLPEALLSGQEISEFFVDLDALTTINRSLTTLFEEVRDIKQQTEGEREVLDARRKKEIDARVVVEEKRRAIARDEAQMQALLAIKTNEKSKYEALVNERERKAAQIRSLLFSLRDSEGIPFGDALQYALNAEKATGVRAAFILAILQQESDFGKNVGSCLMTNSSTGDGRGKNSGTFFAKVMAAPRDTVPFLSITERLGRDWSSTPISCPPSSSWYSGRGYGGGMGPSQFIPSTWELFKKRIGPAVGVSADYADPWNPSHAITATAIYMKDLGAANGGYSAERDAACRYYSGAACRPGRRPANVFYGDQVMTKVKNIQENMIDPLSL